MTELMFEHSFTGMDQAPFGSARLRMNCSRGSRKEFSIAKATAMDQLSGKYTAQQLT